MNKKELEWNVLINDFNSDKIISYNVLDDNYIIDSLKKELKKKKILNKEELKEFLRGKLMAKYWSRTEYEILISGLFNKDKAYKIDAWKQIEINLDRIVEYINSNLKLGLNWIK